MPRALRRAERRFTGELVLVLSKSLQVEGIEFFVGRRQLLQPSFVSRLTTWFTFYLWCKLIFVEKLEGGPVLQPSL